MPEDKLVTLKGLKEFKRLIETKLPDMVESVFSSDEEEPEDEESWGVEISKTDSLIESENQHIVETKVLYAPKVVGQDDLYENWDKDNPYSPAVFKIVENTCGVCPYIVVRIKYTKDWQSGIISFIYPTNDSAVQSDGFDIYTSETRNYYVVDQMFDLTQFKPQDWSSVVLHVEKFEMR